MSPLVKIQILQKYFKGREDHYAYQLTNGAYNGGEYDRTTGEKILSGPLKLKDYQDHIAGIKTLGQYQITTDDKVHWLCIDLDNETTSADELERATTFLDGLNINFIVEESSPARYHIWILMTNPLPAKIAYDFGVSVRAHLFGAIKREFFPKQPSRGSGFGNLIRLPLGKHQAKQTWSQFIDIKTSLLPTNTENIIIEADKLLRSRIVDPERRIVPPREYNSSHVHIDAGKKAEFIKRSEAAMMNMTTQELVQSLLGLQYTPQVGQKIECPFHKRGDNGSSGTPSFTVGGARMPNCRCWSDNCRLGNQWLSPIRLVMELNDINNPWLALNQLEEMAGTKKSSLPF